MNLLNSRIAYSVIKANNGELMNRTFSQLVTALKRYCAMHHIELNQSFSTVEEIQLFLKRHSKPNALKEKIEKVKGAKEMNSLYQFTCENLGVNSFEGNIQAELYSNYNNAYILSNLRSLSTFITCQIFNILPFPYQEDLLQALSRKGETSLLRDLAYISSKLGGRALFHQETGVVLYEEEGKNTTPFNLLSSEKQIWAVLYLLVENGSINAHTLVMIDDIILPDAINLSFDVNFVS